MGISERGCSECAMGRVFNETSLGIGTCTPVNEVAIEVAPANNSSINILLLQ